VDASHAFLVTRAMWRKLWTLSCKAAFDAPHHPHHGGEARATKKSAVELQSHVFFPFFLPPFLSRKICRPLQNKKNKEVWVFICWVKWSPHYFNCKYLILNPLLIFFNFIHLHLIFILNSVLIFLLIFLFFSYPILNWNYFSISSLMVFSVC